jgi:hypothetical protein
MGELTNVNALAPLELVVDGGFERAELSECLSPENPSHVIRHRLVDSGSPLTDICCKHQATGKGLRVS